MRAIPPFCERKTGTALICGPAPSLFDDFRKARQAFPCAELFALSWAIRAVRARHVVSQHYEMAAVFRGFGRHDHPGHEFLIHSQVPPRQDYDRYPAVDHFWDVANDATNSAIASCLIALEMGFDQVVLAGVLLDGTPGYAVDTGQPVFWDREVSDHAGEIVMRNFQHHFRSMEGRVFAMSGRPRAMFGPPPGLESK